METRKIVAIVVLVLIFLVVLAVARSTNFVSTAFRNIGFQSASQWNSAGTTSPPANYAWNTSDLPESVDFSAGGFQYRLVDTTTNPSGNYGGEIYNARLTRTDKNGTKTVIENLRQKFPNILNQSNQALSAYYFPSSSDVIFFVLKTYDQSRGTIANRLFRYDAARDLMKDLSVNRYFLHGAIPSPFDGRIILGIDDGYGSAYQRLYLTNLEADSARLLVDLKNDETLAAFLDQAGNNSTVDVRWLDQHTVEYGVYRKSVQGNQYQTGAWLQLIEKRRVTI